MWLIARFQPTALFSLRPANATTSGGKTLLTPTPYAVKMALLDAAARVYGKANAVTWFPRIRDLEVAIALPQHIMVNNTFVKIMRPHKNGPKDTQGTGLMGPMGSTIAYREMVQFGGVIRLALREQKPQDEHFPLSDLLAQIHYFGKRGGFMQIVGVDSMEAIDEEFTDLNSDEGVPFYINGMLQMLDDCGPKMTFDHADVYSKKNVALDKSNGRILRTVILPYRLERSSRGFSLYQRI